MVAKRLLEQWSYFVKNNGVMKSVYIDISSDKQWKESLSP